MLIEQGARHILRALGGAAMGALAGYIASTQQDPKNRTDLSVFVVAGSVVCGVIGFGIPLIFFKSARSIPAARALDASGSTKRAQKYVALINGKLSQPLHKIGWLIQTIRAEGNVVLLRLKADRGSRMADMQRIFSSEHPDLVQLRNGNAPENLVRALYEVEKIVFPQMGIRTLKLRTPPPTEADRYRRALGLFRQFFGRTLVEGDFVVATL